MSDTLQSRFWSKVDKSGECWLWTGATQDGYGRFGTPEGSRRVHRVAYEWLVGPIPEGLQLDHLCRVRNCVNPGHLEPVTGRENLLRGNTVTARNAAKTHCVNGHAFTAENIYTRTDGGRECRKCMRFWRREWYRRQKVDA